MAEGKDTYISEEIKEGIGLQEEGNHGENVGNDTEEGGKKERLEKELRDVKKQLVKMEKFTSQVIWAFVGAVEAKDNYTSGHSQRVAEYAWKISKKMGKDREEQRQVYYVGLLHDIGKIGIPDTIINKPERLTEEEFAIVKTHPAIGSDILATITSIQDVSTGARWHHERYDGKGYPDGLKGEEIPEIARIIAVADAYDAMTSKRSYRGIMPREKVREEIEKGRGTQFDPEIADMMLELIEEDVYYEMHG